MTWLPSYHLPSLQRSRRDFLLAYTQFLVIPTGIPLLMPNRIRVLHIADLVNRYDFIDNVVRHLDPELFEPWIVTFSLSSNIESPNYSDTNVRHVVIPARGRRDYPFAAYQLLRLLHREQIDIVHSHHYDPTFIAFLSTSLARSTRLIVGRQYADFIFRFTSGLKRQSLLAIENFIYQRASRIVVPANSVRSLLVSLQHISPEVVEVIPYPFDPTRYPIPSRDQRASLREQLGVTNRFCIVTAGRLHPAKGHIFLVRALAELRERIPQLLWIVAGDGPERASIHAAVDKYQLTDSVRFLGWRHDIPALMHASDIVVQPSIEEGFGQVIIESLWMERALVTTRTSGASELLTDGTHAILVPPRDSSSLADAIARLFQDDKAREELGASGRSYVMSTLAIPPILARYEDMYKAVAAKSFG